MGDWLNADLLHGYRKTDSRRFFSKLNNSFIFTPYRIYPGLDRYNIRCNNSYQNLTIRLLQTLPFPPFFTGESLILQEIRQFLVFETTY